MDLVILAAGMGSRFGGLKQIEPMDDYGNFIIDYSIYDALEAGFDRVIFIIKEENLRVFKETVGRRIEDKIKVEYVFQKLDFLPEGYSMPADRVKPLGTGQAILACKDVVSDTFAIINADDFYGKESFIEAAKFLKESANERKYGNIAYLVPNTMTENGSVKRGVLKTNEKGYLESICESVIEKKGGKILCTPLDTQIEPFTVSKDTLVSMNLFCFHRSIMNHLEEKFKIFLDKNQDKLDTCEYLLPSVVSELINEGKVDVDVITSKAVWYGVTYKEDKPFVVSSIKKLVENGNYKIGLW